MQRHEFSVELDAPPEEVWEVFWYRGARPAATEGRQDAHRDPPSRRRRRQRPRPPLLLPGAASGWVSGGVGQSWEWLTEVKPYRVVALRRGRQAAVVARDRLAHGSSRLGDGRTRVHFTEEYEAFNPIMRVLFEKRVHDFISRDNDTILAALQGGLRWHRKRKAREAAQ